ncbi:CheR family methyltransferase [Stakelama tenebrarum]|uniref:Protein-glutamate O-methyltransferase CheR n=1 Tax=Stakelama tenebrarum TaxID=2711215 RepID=A0A6G6Y6A4_9SPHN|nr:protein-glutamate O-methyltransferase CheR [Sphingosinithalassobacter tenebrarum]QIG80248.1 protein-glutamate O-methyltransferase CheR [Sphingosinithalassobacter tenebrarum]
MMHAQPVAAASSGAMNMIAALLEQRTGQQIAANRAWRIETAVKPILRELNLETLDQLVSMLITARDSQIADRLVDALLNQETSFFRDAAVLDTAIAALADLQQEAPQRRLRIWSAGCATGQEPLSLAMLLSEQEAAGNWNIPEIVATDISVSALERARTGRYSQFEIQRGLPVRRMMQWFEGKDSGWTARPELVRRIRFRQHNLSIDPPPPGRFDMILCRNVMLYFSLSLRRRVFETLAEALRPGGLLVLGAGETVIGQTDAFVPSQRYRGFYARLDSEAAPSGGTHEAG